MRTIRLGTSGVEVSALCLGAMYFGSHTDKELSTQLLDQYVDAGGTFLDSANIYSRWIPGFVGGESEEFLGNWMKERNNRSQMFITTKVGFEMPGVERGLKAEQIEAECEKSLSRLGVDTIDLFYAHVDDRNTPLEETMKAFSRLVESGKVRYIGASNYLAWRLEEAYSISKTNQLPQYCCVQQRYSYLRPTAGASFGPQIAANDDLLDYSRSRGVTILAYSPLLGGAYTRTDKELPEQYVSSHNQARLKIIQEIAEEKQATVNQIVLSWMIHSQPAVIPVMGVSTSDQMTENLKTLAIHLSSEDMERLNQA